MEAADAKLKLIESANILSAAIVLAAAQGGKSPKSGLPITFDPKDQGTQEAILGAYEIAKSEYWGEMRGFADTTGVWPDPVVATAAAANPAAALSGLLKLPGLPAPAVAALQTALSLIQNPAATSAPVPAPGSDIPAPTVPTATPATPPVQPGVAK